MWDNKRNYCWFFHGRDWGHSLGPSVSEVSWRKQGESPTCWQSECLSGCPGTRLLWLEHSETCLQVTSILHLLCLQQIWHPVWDREKAHRLPGPVRLQLSLSDSCCHWVRAALWCTGSACHSAMRRLTREKWEWKNYEPKASIKDVKYLCLRPYSRVEYHCDLEVILVKSRFNADPMIIWAPTLCKTHTAAHHI